MQYVCLLWDYLSTHLSTREVILNEVSLKSVLKVNIVRYHKSRNICNGSQPYIEYLFNIFHIGLIKWNNTMNIIMILIYFYF